MSKGRIDPYKAAGIAFGLGKLNTLSDMASFGALLGAIGAFDDESADDPPITVHKSFSKHTIRNEREDDEISLFLHDDFRDDYDNDIDGLGPDDSLF